MDWNNPDHQKIMKLEGIKKTWMPPRESGYDITRRALNIQSRGFHSSRRNDMRVGVLGAGVAGLQVVRSMKARGIDVVAFDSAPQPGGLWQENYSNFSLQVPKQLFEFPDFPNTDVKNGVLPSGPQVQDYILKFVEKFELGDSLALNTTVTRISRDGESGWTFQVRSTNGDEREEKFDYCVVSHGMYSTFKNLPRVENLETTFKGKVVHTSDFRDPRVTSGKKVVVVGGCKSAMDVAVEASNAGASSVTILQRHAHWPVPHHIAWIIPFQYIFLSRFGQMLVSAHRGVYPAASPLMKTFRFVGWPVMKPVFSIVESLFAFQFGLTGDLRPKSDIVTDFYAYGHLLDYTLKAKKESGDIIVINGELSKATSPDEFKLTNGLKIEADIVIFGTGFKKNYSVFSSDVQDDLDIQNDGLYLYRHMLPSHVKNLAFIGSEIATISNILTFGLQAEWLARKLSGFQSDSMHATSQEMQTEVEALKTWKRGWMQQNSSRANLILLHQTHYHDHLLKDMKIDHLRKFPNILAEFLMPYAPQDYNNIIGK